MYSCLMRDLLDSQSDGEYFFDLGREYPLLSEAEPGTGGVFSIVITGVEEYDIIVGAG